MHYFQTIVLIAGLALGLFLFSCKKETEEITPIEPTEEPLASGVTHDLSAVPYNTLAEYHFFKGDLTDQLPTAGVFPYEPARMNQPVHFLPITLKRSDSFGCQMV
jgi:hypothetical protein